MVVTFEHVVKAHDSLIDGHVLHCLKDIPFFGTVCAQCRVILGHTRCVHRLGLQSSVYGQGKNLNGQFDRFQVQVIALASAVQTKQPRGSEA